MALQGNEILYVLPVQANGQPAAILEQTTVAAIAALAATEASFTSTSIATVGNGTLTAAGLVGGQIVRTGPVAAYSDATDTAAAIVAALPGGIAQGSFTIQIKNATAFPQTITAGSGVTLPITVVIPPFSAGMYTGTIQSATAVTFIHRSTQPISTGTRLSAPSLGALNTVGAGAITAALISGGMVARGGAQTATPFTDTTDTGTAIVAACMDLVGKVGAATTFTYVNNTNAPATITGGVGVTVSNITVVPQFSWVTYLVTQTAANTITMVAVQSGQNEVLPNSQFVTNTTVTTFAAGQLTGSDFNIYANTANTPGTINPRTAAQMIADIPNAFIGLTWITRIYHGGTGTLTVATNSVGVTVTGTNTIATTTWRDFACSITGAAAITMQNIGSGTA